MKKVLAAARDRYVLQGKITERLAFLDAVRDLVNQRNALWFHGFSSGSLLCIGFDGDLSSLPAPVKIFFTAAPTKRECWFRDQAYPEGDFERLTRLLPCVPLLREPPRPPRAPRK